MAYRYNEHGDIYEYDERDGMKKLFTGLLVGAAIGGVLMLFLAPASGKKTLSRLKKRTRALRHDLMDTMDDRMGAARHRLDKATAGARKQAKHLAGRGMDALDEQRERVSEAVETGRKRMRFPGR